MWCELCTEHTSECGSSWMHIEKRFVLPRIHIPDTVSDALKVPKEKERRAQEVVCTSLPLRWDKQFALKSIKVTSGTCKCEAQILS